MSGQLSVQQPQLRTGLPLGEQVTTTTPTKTEGRDGGRKVKELRKKFQCELDEFPKTKGPPGNKSPQSVPKDRNVKLGWPPKTEGIVSSKGPKPEPKPTSNLSPKDYNYKEYVQKFGSKTANLYEIERLGGKVPERCPVSTKEIFDHILANDKENVIKDSWETMKKNGVFDDANLKKITDKIEEIFNKPGGFPFTKEQRDWINLTMAGKVIIARSTGDEDSADTPNAGGNESILFVEPTTASVSKAMKDVVLSYFGGASIRNRTQGDGVGTVLSGLPKMPVLLMEMISEPIKDSSKVDKGEPPPIGIAMSTNKVEFTGGEDFHFVSISSAVGPGVNEGSGRIEVDETFVMQSKDGTPLLIFQQPSVKQERIRAVKDEQSGKISSQMEKNSKQLAYSSSLSRDQVRALVTTTDQIKMLNKGNTTEVEGVVGGDKQINFVQHRQIPDTRSKVDPTYVNTGKSDGHSQVFNYKTVVPKSGDALVITDWSQVCFAETMKEAESLFDWDHGTHKIVIVRQPDCSNSHPAVNFGSHKKDGLNGKKEPDPIPCLVVPNYGELLALKEKSTLAPNQPLVIDGQTQKAFVWNDTSFDPNTAIEKGRISHHIGLETSVTDKTIQDVVGKLKTTKSDQIGTLKKDLDPILKSYAKKIEDLETLLTKNSDTIHNSEGLLCQLKTAKENFEAVKAAFTEILAGNPKYTFDEGTHARLLLVKFLESSMHGIDQVPQLIEAEKSASRYLQAMKESQLTNPVFGDQVQGVKDGLTGPLMMKWKRFLTLAEQSGLSKQEISDFKGMMENLDKMGLTANWMSTVFDKKYADIMPSRDVTGKNPVSGKAKELLQALVKDYQETGPFLEKQLAFQGKLEDAERSVADFAMSSNFEKAFKNLKGLAETFIKEPWPKDLNQKPLKKAAQIESLGRLIEVYDSSIKALKKSDFPTEKLVEKELEMLDTFKELFESVFTKTDLPSSNLDSKSGYVGKLDAAYKSIKEKVDDQTSKSDVAKLKEQSRCGKSFNVTQCLFNNKAKQMPSNVEEMFTTLHQGLEDIRGGLMVGGASNYDIDMPKDLRSLLSIIPQAGKGTRLGRPPVLVGREITSEGVSYTYNLLVNDHGVKIKCNYEKPTPENPNGKTSLDIDFYADNTGGRLKNMAKLTEQFSPDSERTWGDNQFKAKFEVGSEADRNRLAGYLPELVKLSVSTANARLAKVVNTNTNPVTGEIDTSRRRVLNDFLNVALGIVAKKPEKGAAPQTVPTTDLGIQFGYPKSFSFENMDDRVTYTLDLGKPDFGLSPKVFAKIPPKMLEEAKKVVIEGPSNFTFKLDKKDYTIDLTRGDLGLSERDIKRLGINTKHLQSLRDDLSNTLEQALAVNIDEGVTNLNKNWQDQIFGPPMAYLKKGDLPELTLWKAVTGGGKGRTDKFKSVDQALTRALNAKYALHEARQKLAEEGGYPSPKATQDYRNALKQYHSEVQKALYVSSGYMGSETEHGEETLELLKKLHLARAGVETELEVNRMDLQLLTPEEKSALPFAKTVKVEDVELNRATRQAPRIILERGKSNPVTEDRSKIGETITALNKQILGAMGSLTSDVDKDKYSTAMGLLESSKHLMRGSDLATIESTWKTNQKEAIDLILHVELVSGVSDVEVLSKPKGTQVGLTNGGADCFINSSLQLLASLGGIRVPQDMPQLGKFLTGDIHTGQDCRNLRNELRDKPFNGVGEIRDAINSGGTAVSQQDAAAALALLLNKINAPKLEFTKKLTRTSDRVERLGQAKKESVLPLQLPQNSGPHSLSGLVTSNLTSQVEVGNWDDRTGNHQATQTLTLKSPGPDTAVVSLSRFSYDLTHGAQKRREVVSGITNPVTMTDSSGNRVSYEPRSIICHLGTGVGEGHYITYRKEGADWLLFNDNNEVGVKVDLNAQPHKERVERDSYVVAMAKVGVPYTPPVVPPIVPQVIPQAIPPSVTPSKTDSQVKGTSSVSKGSEPITGSGKQVQSESRTVTPWVPSKQLGIRTENLEKPDVLSPPTRPQVGTHELHSKAFKALFDKGTKFPDPSGVKNGAKLAVKVNIDGKDYDITATAKKAKGSGAVIWMVSLTESGKSPEPTEFVVKTNPKKTTSERDQQMQEYVKVEWQKNLREVQVLDHMSGNEHALQFHGCYAMGNGTLVYGMEKAQGDMLEVLTAQTKARQSNTLVPSKVDNHLLEMSQALRDIHATGQVHGDVKADNFMLGSDGRARIADFGECYMKDSSTEKTTLKDEMERFATMAFNLRYGLQAKTDDLQTAIESQQKDLQRNFDTKILEMENALTKQISQLQTLNPQEPLIAQLNKQLVDLRDPGKMIDTILHLSGGKLDDESMRSYLINDLLLKTLQTPAPTFDTMNQVSTQLAKLVAR